MVPLKPLFERLDGRWATPMMTAADVREVSQVHEIGAHSFEHASMAYETDAYLAADARRCRTWFRDRVGLDPQIYAFPNGSLREAQPAVVRDLGYPVVLDVGERFSRLDATLHSRFTFYADSLAEARFRAVGGRLDPRSQIRDVS
jgi:peptidoglycan/xylan/chitin deacetylase (PgdA/CDA1 family)